MTTISMFLAIGVGVIFLVAYGYGVRLYLWGEGREKLEIGVRALLILKENGGILQISRRSEGVLLILLRQEGPMNRADLRLRIPLNVRSLRQSEELKRAFTSNGYGFNAMEGSTETIAEVPIRTENMGAVGSEEEGVEAANLALDALGFGKDARFIYQLKGKGGWRRWNRLRSA